MLLRLIVQKPLMCYTRICFIIYKQSTDTRTTLLPLALDLEPSRRPINNGVDSEIIRSISLCKPTFHQVLVEWTGHRRVCKTP